MLHRLFMQLEGHGLREAEQVVTNRLKYKWTFEALVGEWTRFISEISRFDQFKAYSTYEYIEYLDRRILLVQMQMLISFEGREISNQILYPLDEKFFQETRRIEKPLSDSIPGKYYIFYYQIPKLENQFFIANLRTFGIID